HLADVDALAQRVRNVSQIILDESFVNDDGLFGCGSIALIQRTPSFEADADRAEVIGHDRAVLRRGPSLARRPAGDFAEDFAIESFLICRNDAWFLQFFDALLYSMRFSKRETLLSRFVIRE